MANRAGHDGAAAPEALAPIDVRARLLLRGAANYTGICSACRQGASPQAPDPERQPAAWALATVRVTIAHLEDCPALVDGTDRLCRSRQRFGEAP